MTVKHKVVFAGLARDCAHALPRILGIIEDFGNGLDDWGYVFLENNSVDKSFRKLQAFDRRHGRGIVRSYGDLQAEIPKRTARLAMLRNQCIEEIQSNDRLRDFDYLIVLDLDAVNERFDKSRILELFDTREPDWTAIFANQSERYYDIWALRHPTWSPDDCWKRVRERPEDMSHEDAVKEFVVNRRKSLDPSRGFVEVDSAFGGFGLYRIQDIRDCRYSGIADDGSEVCEHVAFHACLRKNGGRLFIDATLINGRGNHRHNAGMGLKTVLLRAINKKMNRPHY